MQKEVILTGLRSNAEFHLGNYLGAILPMVELQKHHAGRYQLNMFIPDLHSFTTPIEHGNLYEQTLSNLITFVATGLDINQPDTYIYRQSFIPAHSELTWILDCFAYFGELSRMTEFKDIVTRDNSEGVKSSLPEPGRQPHTANYESVSVGLFNYPVLMAAEILLYGAKWVPVGDDQRQHVEFTRDLGIRLNNKFGDLFTVPEDNTKQMEFAARTQPVRIHSLRNPTRKMSKSVEDPAGTILLSDKPESAAEKVRSATTDSEGSINFDMQKQPGISNLLQILALLTGTSQPEIIARWQGNPNYGELKEATAKAVAGFLSDFQVRLAKVSQPALMNKLQRDEQAMSRVADTTLLRVQKAVGLRPA